VVTDLGGGSTELVVGTWDGTRAEITGALSVDIGCVRITERCLRGDPPTEAEVAAARAVTAEVLRPAFDTVPIASARTWVGVAGTVTTLSAVAQELPGYDAERTHLSRLSRADIGRTVQRLLAATRDERAANPTIHPGRVDVIGGGALITEVLAEKIADAAGITELLVSEHDILDGIALSIR
jgi:exopolyphosphatase/guanosine-5'-triphosphate,3'-diphosphate pyrophosphatase